MTVFTESRPLAPRLDRRPPTLSPAMPCRLTTAGPGLYRVLGVHGRIIGHLAVIEHPGGPRYRAQRFQPSLGAFRTLGDFWSADDAVGCLRAS